MSAAIPLHSVCLWNIVLRLFIKSNGRKWETNMSICTPFSIFLRIYSIACVSRHHYNIDNWTPINLDVESSRKEKLSFLFLQKCYFFPHPRLFEIDCAFFNPEQRYCVLYFFLPIFFQQSWIAEQTKWKNQTDIISIRNLHISIASTHPVHIVIATNKKTKTQQICPSWRLMTTK